MQKQKKIAAHEERVQSRPGPKQCPREFCQSWMDSQATECPYCNYPMLDFKNEVFVEQRIYGF